MASYGNVYRHRSGWADSLCGGALPALRAGWREGGLLRRADGPHRRDKLTGLGLRLGLDVKLWKPGTQAEDPSKLFIRMPINVEVAGGYHTAAIFFDRISKLSRIVTVQDVRIGAARVDQGRVVTQTVFDLVAYAAPQEKKPAAPVPAAKPK